MDGVYRYQRHIYDLTRKYYLLGRDRLIADLAVPDGGTVLEIGCGTGRNLIAVGKAWPRAALHGVDISEAMLDTARGSVAKHRQDRRATRAERSRAPTRSTARIAREGCPTGHPSPC